jgi:SAM-dependent methyltransferase
MSWATFWNRPNAIYAGDRHLRAHYARLLADLRPHLTDRPPRAVLDYGCGEALAAEALAATASRVFLYDASPAIRARLAARVGPHPRIAVLDEAALAGLPGASIDLALMISVVQYLDAATLRGVLGALHRLLAADARLIVADVIEPETPLFRELGSRLRFSAGHGFLLADLAALLRLFLSDYRDLQRRAGFATYRPDAFADVLRAAGFAAERLTCNIGPTAHRLAFLARPKPASSAGSGATSRGEAEASATQGLSSVL